MVQTSRVIVVGLMVSIVLLICGQATATCADGWLQFRHRTSSSSTICVLVIREKLPWQEAKQACEKHIGHLLNVDFISNYQTNRQESAWQNIIKSFPEFWSGMHLADRRLMWHAYGPKYLWRSKFSGFTTWQWDKGQPSYDTGSCGHVMLNETQLPEQPPTITITAKLDNCETRLPYVCQKDNVFNQRVSEAPFCSKDWVGNVLLTTCFRLFNKAVSADEAVKQCKSQGGNIVPANSFYQKRIIDNVVSYYISTEEKQVEVWVQRTPSSEEGAQQCSTYITMGGEGFAGPALCNRTVIYICEKPTSVSVTDQIDFNVASPYIKEDLTSYSPFATLPVTWSLTEPLPANGHPIVFMTTPTRIFNSTNKFQGYRFSSQNGPWYSQTYSVLSNLTSNILATVTLPPERLITPQKRSTRRQVSRTKREAVSGTNLYLSVGYYSAGLYTINPPSYTQGKPVLVRYANPDLLIYLVSIEASENLFTGFTREDATSFSMIRDETYWVGEYTGNLNSPLDITLIGEGAITHNGRLPEDIRNNTVTYKEFVTVKDGRNKPDDFEQTVLQTIREHWITTMKNSRHFKVDTLQVMSTVMCSKLVDQSSGKTVTFPSTHVGRTAYSWERCYGSKGALASARCVGGYDVGVTWDKIVFSEGCRDMPTLNESSVSSDLKNLSKTALTPRNADDILDETSNLTRPSVNLTEADVIYVADILYNTWKTGTTSPSILEKVYDIANNILQAPPRSIEQAQKMNNAANRIIRAVDEITNRLYQSGRFVRPYVSSEVWAQTGNGSVVIGIDLESTENDVIMDKYLTSIKTAADVTVNETDTAIYVSEKLVTGVRTRLILNIYSRTDLFNETRGRYLLVSNVAAARLTVNNTQVFKLGEDNVTAVFTIKVTDVTSTIVCGYWAYEDNQDAGGWRTDGCTYTLVQGNAVCSCNHLTNFAVLIDLEAASIPEQHKQILDIITKVGLIISMIGLGLTLLTFVIFRHLRSGRGQQVLVNLSLSMFCSALVFLVGMDRVDVVVGCKVVAVLLHYFILVSFMWMLVEALLQYLRFVKVLGTYIPNFIVKAMVPAWGIPIIPVIIVLAIDHDLYYGGKGYCWLAYDAMLYAFIVPVALIMLANLVVFILVLVKLLRRRNKGMISNQSERKMAYLHFQAAVSIFVVLGLTWIFGFLAVDGAQVTFHYVFAILNAFQGFFLFLLFTAREKKIRDAWKKMLCRKSAYKKATSSDSHPSQPKSTSNTKSSDLLTSSSKTSAQVEDSNESHDDTDAVTFKNVIYDNKT